VAKHAVGKSPDCSVEVQQVQGKCFRF
jgi:hypothetical protein